MKITRLNFHGTGPDRPCIKPKYLISKQKTIQNQNKQTNHLEFSPHSFREIGTYPKLAYSARLTSAFSFKKNSASYQTIFYWKLWTFATSFAFPAFFHVINAVAFWLEISSPPQDVQSMQREWKRRREIHSAGSPHLKICWVCCFRFR